MTDSSKKLSKDDKQLYDEACSKSNPDLVNRIFNRISANQKKKWANAGIATTQMFPGLCHHTYGRYTSSISESLNSAYEGIRKMSIADSLLEVVNREADVICRHMQMSLSCSGKIPPKSGTSYLEGMEKESKHFIHSCSVTQARRSAGWSIITTCNGKQVSEEICGIRGDGCSCQRSIMTVSLFYFLNILCDI